MTDNKPSFYRSEWEQEKTALLSLIDRLRKNIERVEYEAEYRDQDLETPERNEPIKEMSQALATFDANAHCHIHAMSRLALSAAIQDATDNYQSVCPMKNRLESALEEWTYAPASTAAQERAVAALAAVQQENSDS